MDYDTARNTAGYNMVLDTAGSVTKLGENKMDGDTAYGTATQSPTHGFRVTAGALAAAGIYTWTCTASFCHAGSHSIGYMHRWWIKNG